MTNSAKKLETLIGRAEERPAPADPEAPAFSKMAEIAVEGFSNGPRGPILQAPVDDGRTLAFLASRVDFVIGIGEDRDLVDLADERVRRKGQRNFSLLNQNLIPFPSPDGSFAGVYCADYLGHLRKPARAIREMLRVCAPGGLIVAEFIAPQDCTRGSSGMEPSTDGGYIHADSKTFYRYLDLWRLEEILGEAGAGKLEVKCEEKSWRSDGNIESQDVLALRKSWVVQIRRNRP